MQVIRIMLLTLSRSRYILVTEKTLAIFWLLRPYLHYQSLYFAGINFHAIWKFFRERAKISTCKNY